MALHGEVKWHEGEPVLVEVGSRCHGAEGFGMPVADSVYGYNQVDCAVDCYISPANFQLNTVELLFPPVLWRS